MIIVPQPSEKLLDGFSTDAQIYYATIPSPRPTPPPPDDAGVDSIARQLDDELYIDEEPPAYDAHPTPPAQTATAGDVKDRNLYNKRSSDHNDDIPRNIPRGASYNSRGLGGSFDQGRGIPAFEPLVMHSRSKNLEDGFYSMLPPTDIQPHPLNQRDVGESDWKKFLEDLRTSARLSLSGQSSPTPQLRERPNFFQNMGSMIRSFNSTGKQTDNGNHRGPAALVDTWNENYFHRRGLEVVLAKGTHRLNGNKNLPPPDCTPSNEDLRMHPSGAVDGSRSSPTLAMPSMPMPSMPSMPPMPSMSPMPSMPPMPPMPPMPSIPSMPAIPSPSGRANEPRMSPTLHVPGAFDNANDEKHVRRSNSSSSLSSSSDSDSDSDSDSGHGHRRQLSAGPSLERSFSSRAERRAEKRARRIERKLRRAERKKHRREKHRERDDTRYAHKLSRWQAEIAARGFGRGMNPYMGRGWSVGRSAFMGRGAYAGRGCSVPMGGGMPMMGGYRGADWSGRGYGGRIGGGPFALVQGIASLMNKDDDGYYRLIVIDRI